MYEPLDAHWYLLYGGALAIACALSLALTAAMRRFALRFGILDHPGERKMHREPIPLMGGVAIFITFNVTLLALYLASKSAGLFNEQALARLFNGAFGEKAQPKLAGILLGGLLIFALGVIDDLKALKPEAKLAGQVIAALALVASGVRIEMFVLSNVFVSALVTVLWVVLLTNSLNFLDNMDGLAGGVSVIAAFSFFLAVLPYEDHLVRLLLMAFAGAVAGFLYHNLNPARIFMGDAGAMFCGYILATVAILGTFHVEATPSRIAVAAPLLALSVPLFDTLSVIAIRWWNGESIMKGDKRHFSHRLVEAGMSPERAVQFIYLVAAVTGLGGALLSQVSLGGTLIIITQTVGMFLLIVLLMTAGRRPGSGAP